MIIAGDFLNHNGLIMVNPCRFWLFQIVISHNIVWWVWSFWSLSKLMIHWIHGLDGCSSWWIHALMSHFVLFLRVFGQFKRAILAKALSINVVLRTFSRTAKALVWCCISCHLTLETGWCGNAEPIYDLSILIDVTYFLIFRCLWCCMFAFPFILSFWITFMLVVFILSFSYFIF